MTAAEIGDSCVRIVVTDIAAEVIGEFYLEKSCQVATLRQRVQELSSVPVYEQHLICGNTVLGDALFLSDVACGHVLEVTLLRVPQPCAVTAGSDGNFMVWDLRDGHCCRYLPFSSPVLCLSVDWAVRILLTGHTDCFWRLWDLDRGACLREMSEPNTAPRCVAFDWDGKMAVTGSAAMFVCCMPGPPTPTLALWDLAAGRYIQGWSSGGSIKCLSADWAQCQVLVAGGSLELFDFDKRQLQWEATPRDPVQAMAVDWPSQTAITAGLDSIQVWKLDRQECIQVLTHCGHIQQLEMDWPRRVFLSAGVRNGELICWAWDLQEWCCSSEKLMGFAPSRCVALDIARGTCLYSCDARENDLAGDELKLFDLAKGCEVMELMGHSDHVMCASMS
ncbi:unnamed protein product [Effrenium voratum]|nr:unnamed protein product [Effrenium voratum]